jgi:NADH-quinone oxidoreductase subunit J
VSDARYVILLAVVLGAVGVGLMLPRPNVRARMLGALAGAVALGLLFSQVPLIGDWISQSVLWILAGVTLFSAAAAISLRNPVYCAIWFGLSLCGTAGLFLFQGAQFLAVATIVIYAGAILVTFLFVLMLAEPGGRAAYDRASWEAMLSAAAGTLLVGFLSMTVAGVLTGERGQPPKTVATDENRAAHILHEEHVLKIGRELYSRQLVAVEAAAALLFAALIGATAIVRREQFLKAAWKRGGGLPPSRSATEAFSAEGDAGRDG